MLLKTDLSNQTIYTLSEISSTCKKAARGMDMPWGMAEEAGMVVKALSKFRIDGCGALAKYFKWRAENTADLQGKILIENDTCKSLSGALCPLMSSAILSDRSHELLKTPMQFQNLHFPIIFLGQAFLIARQKVLTLRVNFDDYSCLISFEGISLIDDRAVECLYQKAETVAVEITDEQFIASYVQRNNGMAVDNQVWQYLSQLAHHTYAPESEASRLSGAGAGLQDND